MIFTVTPIYALAAALIYMTLWMRVTSMRGAMGQSIGDGGDTALLLRLYLHIGGALMLIGRVAHPFGLKTDNAGHVLRYVGNGTNMLAALNLMVCLGVNILGL